MLFPDDQSLPFNNPKVREAAHIAIDRQAICDKILNGAAVPYGDLIPPWLPGYSAEKAKAKEYNPEKAKQLLSEAGYADGFDTTMIYPLTNKPEFQAVAQNLASVGIRCKLSEVDDGTWVETVMGKQTKGLVYDQHWWGGALSLNTIISQRFALNTTWGYVTNDQTDALQAKLATMLPESEYAALSRSVVDDLLAIDPGFVLWVRMPLMESAQS
jgi:peptide/nickel transport system substrate-binding protein